MNSGAEGVETALKVARRWGYEVKGVPEGEATIVVMDGNFHGRTISIVSFSGDHVAKAHYGPYTPGFRSVPYGDADAVAAAIDETTVAVLVEPVQGEAGVVVPPEGYLREVKRHCVEHEVLMIADEIQSGLGRTGRTFACEHEAVTPDMYILGKALGGGIIPLSAVAADRDVLGVLTPGSHGSTFGGNPLAVAVGRAVIAPARDGRAAAQRRAAGGAPPAGPGEADRAGRARDPGARAVGGCRRRPRPRHRPRPLRGARAPRRTRQGHARLDHPDLASADHQRGGPDLGSGPPRRGHSPSSAPPAPETR